jgi:hypothetical protein
MSYPSAKRNLHRAPIGDSPEIVRFVPTLTEDSDREANRQVYEVSIVFGRDLRTCAGVSPSGTVGVV